MRRKYQDRINLVSPFHGKNLYIRTRRHRRFIRSMQLMRKYNFNSNLFDLTCYTPTPCNDQHQIRPLLRDAPRDDVVSRLECALLAGLELPPHFTHRDLYAMYIPSRRLVAFAYATLQPEIGDNFIAAVKEAHVPTWYVQKEVYPNIKHMTWLSNFWQERKIASSGVAFLYADKHARMGSAPHLKLLAEMTGIVQDKSQKHELTITMPQPEMKNVTPGRPQLTEARDADLYKQPS